MRVLKRPLNFDFANHFLIGTQSLPIIITLGDGQAVITGQGTEAGLVRLSPISIGLDGRFKLGSGLLWS